MFELVFHREVDGSTHVGCFQAELKNRYGVESELITNMILGGHIVRVTNADFEKITGWRKKKLNWQEKT